MNTKKRQANTIKPKLHTGIDQLLDWAPVIVFALLFGAIAGIPNTPSFDEIHYIAAAKKLIEFKELANPEHPPLAKLTIGLFWVIFHKLLGLNELIAVRIPIIISGLTVLYTFSKLLTTIALPKSLVRPLVWTAALNMCWFVQTKTTMPDMISLCFALMSIYFAFTKKFTASGAFFGLAMACKWSAAPYAVVLFFLARKAGAVKILLALASGAATYYASFIPLMFIAQSPLTPLNFIEFHYKMYDSIVNNAGSQSHPYSSQWWEWLLLKRPMWYTFDPIQTPEGLRDQLYSCIFMGGNPFLFLTGTAAVLYSMVFFIYKKFKIRALNLWPLTLFLVSLIMYIVLPKKTNFFYYVIPASLWFGPALAAALMTKLSERNTCRTLWALNAIALLFFVFMLPITSGSAVPMQTFHIIYSPWMFYLNWI